jgi:tetratricopeptide (TPR) repeat protein
MVETTSANRRWIFGPLPDLLLGSGGLYVALFSAQVVAGGAMQSVLPPTLFPFLTLLLGAPHYGATLLRVFDGSETGRRFVPFTLLLTAAMIGLFAAGLRDVALGSLILSVYVTWSPWHYSGQNYGVALAFLRVRRVAVSPAAKRLLRGSFVTSYLLTALALHGADPSGGYAPVEYEATVYRLVRLNLPRAWLEPLFLLCVGGFAGCSLGAALRLRREAAPGVLAPTALVWLTQTLWFVAPPVARHWGLLPGIDPLAPGNAAYTMMWVAVGHFLQYLWFTTFFAAPSQRLAGRMRYLGRALLAGAALWVLPTLFFAPRLLGGLPYGLGLGVMGAAVVNLHHFVLDGLIWKTTSSGPITRLLVRSGLRAPATPRPWLAWPVWAAGAACVVVALLAYWEAEFGFRRAAERGDVERYGRAVERARWIGRDGPAHHVVLAQLLMRAGDRERARRELDQSLALYPTADAWTTLGFWYERESRWQDALDAYRAATLLDPEDAAALYRTGLVWLQLDQPTAARAALARAAELAPQLPAVRLALERAEARLREGGSAGGGPEPD